MLSPCYMWPQVYTYVPEKFKEWGYRHRLLEDELFKTYKADIMCLQELTTKDYHNFWDKQMKETLNYGSNFISKTPPKYWKRPTDEMDGVGIFYNLDKFEYISSSSIYLNDVLGIFNVRELKYMKETMITLTNGAGEAIGKDNLMNILQGRNQVCLFVSLRHKDTNTVFVVINTHLYWKYDEVKLSQCLTIMRKLERIIKSLLMGVEGVTYSKVKILFSGDLNSNTDSLVVKFLKGEIVEHGQLNLQNPMRPYLNHCIYDDAPSELFDNTCYSGKLKGIFDYIWFHERDFQLNRILSGVEVSKELSSSSEFGLPNERHPSDHIPILTEMEILK